MTEKETGFTAEAEAEAEAMFIADAGTGAFTADADAGVFAAIAEHKANPTDVVPWDEVKVDIGEPVRIIGVTPEQLAHIDGHHNGAQLDRLEAASECYVRAFHDGLHGEVGASHREGV